MTSRSPDPLGLEERCQVILDTLDHTLDHHSQLRKQT